MPRKVHSNISKSKDTKKRNKVPRRWILEDDYIFLGFSC